MCPSVPDQIGTWKCWFLRRGENWSTNRKTSQSKGENQQQTQPTHMVLNQVLNPSHFGGRQVFLTTVPPKPEKKANILLPPLVSLWNDVWEMGTEITYWWFITTQIWVELLIGWRKLFSANQKHYPHLGSDTSSVWNFCISDVISQRSQWWCWEMSAVFSGYATLYQSTGNKNHKHLHLLDIMGRAKNGSTKRGPLVCSGMKMIKHNFL